VAAIGLALSASPGLGASGSISYPVSTAVGSGRATVGRTIELPETGTATFTTSFILPLDYLNNGRVQIVLYLSVAGLLTPCTAQLGPHSMTRSRVGRESLVDLSGLSAANGSPTVDFPDAAVVQKTFFLKRSGLFPNQLKSDLFTISFRRVPDDASDTCTGFVSVHGIDIRYPLQ
jgi:hypothetical protein